MAFSMGTVSGALLEHMNMRVLAFAHTSAQCTVCLFVDIFFFFFLNCFVAIHPSITIRQAPTNLSSTGKALSSSDPSSPPSPWIPGSWCKWRSSGLPWPRITGIFCLWPQMLIIRAALIVVLSTETLPETVETPTTCKFLVHAASRIAMASSWPGSQSSHTDLRW